LFPSHDPYVSDNQDEGGSLGSTHVLMNPKYRAQGYSGGKLVATYIGKPIEGKEKYYEIQEKLLALYGNPQRGLWYEANRGQACRDYYLRRGKTWMLALRPQRAQGQHVHVKKVTQYGWIVGSRVQKIQLLEMLRDWLLEPCEVEYDEIKEVDIIKKRNIDQIDCLFTLKQIEGFDLDEGNWDAVMSLVGAVLGLREHEHLAERNAIKRSSQKNQLAFITENRNLFNLDYHDKYMNKVRKKVKALSNKDPDDLPNPFRKNLE